MMHCWSRVAPGASVWACSPVRVPRDENPGGGSTRKQYDPEISHAPRGLLSEGWLACEHGGLWHSQWLAREMLCKGGW